MANAAKENALVLTVSADRTARKSLISAKGKTVGMVFVKMVFANVIAAGKELAALRK